MKYILLFGLFLFPFLCFTQGVTIGTNNPPDPSAILDLQSTSSGLLPPRLTQTQRNAVPAPAIGLIIYNTTTECLDVYHASGWKTASCNCTIPPPAPLQIIGPALACQNQNGVQYYVHPVPGASSYTWTVPNGATIQQGQNDTLILVNFTTANGNITVTADNTCGSSSPVSLGVVAANPVATFTSTPPTGSINSNVVFSPTATGLNYQWTFTGGNPASSTAQNPTVQWANPGTYNVSLTVTNNAGCTATQTGTITVISCQPVNLTLNNCGQSGETGPSQNQCNATYGPGVVTVNAGIQQWTVPATGTYNITVAGAQGGDGYINSSTAIVTGEQGAIVAANISLNQGDVLNILVGQRGSLPGTTGTPGGGGGGTFVVRSGVPLLAAGGGTGNGNYGAAKGVTTTNGGANGSGILGGTNGSGGNGGSRGAGGGGFSGDGLAASLGPPVPSNPGLAFTNGGTGGAPANWGCTWTNGTGAGGFGGGASGGGACNTNGGAGGGYSGGAGGSNNIAGGGGSYIVAGATNVRTSNGNYNGSGTFGGSPIQNLNAYNSGHGYVTIVKTCP